VVVVTAETACKLLSALTPDFTASTLMWQFTQVNPVREKKLSNVRTTAADEKVFLAPPRVMTLEDAIGAR